MVSICKGESRILVEKTDIDISNNQSAVLTVYRKIYVDDKIGKSLGRVILSEDKYRTIKSIKAKILDINGKTIYKLRKKDIRKYKGSLGYALYRDYLHLAFDISHATLPYIIEYSYKMNYKTLFQFPNWYPQWTLPVDESVLTITKPTSFTINNRIIGDISEPLIINDGNTQRWILHDIPKFEKEYRTPPECKIQYGVEFFPRHFHLEGIRGSNESWAKFGELIHHLFKDQFDISKDAISAIGIDEYLSELEKIEAVYSYIQKNSHYAAISIGIHGWKPHLAQSVFDNKYGDCKDLATLMVAILRKLDIDAYPALVKTRNEGVIVKDFPSNQFNHAISCVPLEHDTLWVDCTSEHATIYDTPENDEGCYALIIKDGKGYLTRIPLSRADDNISIFDADISITANGNAIIKGSLSGIGNSNQYYRDQLIALNNEDRRNVISNWLSDYSPSLTLSQLKINNLENPEKPINVEFEALARQYGTLSRNFLFLVPGFYHRMSFDAEKPSERTFPVFYMYPFSHRDKITYHIPEEFLVDFIPDSISIDNQFSFYKFRIEKEGDNYLYARELKIKNRIINLDQYPEFYEFRELVEKSDKSKMIFRKNRNN